MVRVLALQLTLLTGFAGLVYEVTWQRYLATLLGSHSEATAVVLGIFLGGLATGYAVFGAWTRGRQARAAESGRPAGLLLVYGGVEAAIGAWALAFPFLFDGIRRLSLGLPQPAGGAAFALDACLAALLIGPPTVLMGATIPLLTQALSRGVSDATRCHALVYGLNTAGAFVGALAAGFWLLPSLGLVGVLRAMGTLNLLVGAGFVALDRMAGSAVPPRVEKRPAEVGDLRLLAAAALCVGFAMMTLQTTLIRLGGLSLGSSPFTFSMVVAVFVLCIALGSLGVSALRRVSGQMLVANLWALLVMLALLYTQLDGSPYGAHLLRSFFRDQTAGFYPYQLAVFLSLLVILAPPVVLSGATLPLLFHVLRGEADALGRVAGRLYAWNTLGSLLGAMIGGYAALYWLDLHHVFRLALGALAVAAVLVSVAIARVPRVAAAGLLATTALAIALLGAWSPHRLASGVFRIRRPAPATYAGPRSFFQRYGPNQIVFYDDDPVSSVAVKRRMLPDGRVDTGLITNGKGDGSLVHDYITMSLAALVPALLAEKLERVFVIGWGTGVSVGELASLKPVREVVVAEISPAVVRTAPFFAEGNLDAANNPKVRIVIGDAYRTLQRTEGTFDVIVSEPSNPWVLGVEMLYSRDFLGAARDRLAHGGVHLQWFHLYEIDDETVRMVLRTYASVFDRVSVWYGTGVDLLIVGHRAGASPVDIDRLVERAAEPEFAAALERSGIHGLSGLLAHELLPAGVVRALELEGTLHTLLRPRLGHRAARAFFAGGRGHLPPSARDRAARLGAENSLLQRYMAREGGTLSEDDHAAFTTEVCRHRPLECVTALAWWTRARPDAERDVERRASVEAAIRTDPVLSRNARLDRLDRVKRLFDKQPPSDYDGDSLLRAKRTTDLFYAHYHHAAPFPRSHLESVWRDCESDAERLDACRTARQRAEGVLGPLSVDPPAETATRAP